LFSVLSFLLWNSLWLVEEVLTFLFFFLVIRMEISQFLWEIYFMLCKSLGAGLCRNMGPPLVAPALHGSLISAQPCSSALPYTLIYSFVTRSVA
jgi:hypothetical protein